MTTIELNDQNFSSTIEGSAVPVIVDFWAPWCGPCKMVAPHLEALAAEAGASLVVAKVNVDDCGQAAAQYGVRSIPTLMIFKGGQQVGVKVGAMSKSQLDQWVEQYKD